MHVEELHLLQPRLCRAGLCKRGAGVGSPSTLELELQLVTCLSGGQGQPASPAQQLVLGRLHWRAGGFAQA